MRSVKALRTAKIGYIIISAILCALGILLIAKPDMSLSLIGIIVGIVLIVFGVIKLIGYFSKDLYRLAFQFDLAFGILLIALSVVILIRPENMMSFLCIVLGIAILADGLFKIQTALDARRFGLRTWWLILSLAIIAGVIGAVLVFRPQRAPGSSRCCWACRSWRRESSTCAWRCARSRSSAISSRTSSKSTSSKLEGRLLLLCVFPKRSSSAAFPY